nr:uncharacterized protein LOC116156262 [Camelus dromedarius]
MLGAGQGPKGLHAFARRRFAVKGLIVQRLHNVLQRASCAHVKVTVFTRWALEGKLLAEKLHNPGRLSRSSWGSEAGERWGRERVGGRREGQRGAKGKRALRRRELPGSEPFKTSGLQRGHPKLLLYLETQLGSSGNLPVLMNMKIGRRLTPPRVPLRLHPTPIFPHLPRQGASRPRLDRQLHFRQMPAGTKPRHPETLSTRQWTGISGELGWRLRIASSKGGLCSTAFPAQALAAPVPSSQARQPPWGFGRAGQTPLWGGEAKPSSGELPGGLGNFHFLQGLG